MWSGFLWYKEPRSSSLTALGLFGFRLHHWRLQSIWHGRKHVNVNYWHIAGHDGPYCTKFRVMASDSKAHRDNLLNWIRKDFTPVIVSKLIGRIICIMSANIYMNYYPSTLTPTETAFGIEGPRQCHVVL